MSSNTSTIYLHASAIYCSGAAHYFDQMAVLGTDTASFSYSLDNKSFVKIVDELKMRFSLKIFTETSFVSLIIQQKKLVEILTLIGFAQVLSFIPIQYIKIIIKLITIQIMLLSDIFCIIVFSETIGN